MTGSYEWDPEKNALNLSKHGLSFDAALAAFDGPILTKQDFRRDHGEIRWQSLGWLKAEGCVIMMAYTERNGRIRLISARGATRRETKIFFETIKD
jgi:uncharacterized DUF497 family protein